MDFPTLFGRPAGFAATAPGRVNLLGEHTDYNGGLVLPLATPQTTRVEIALRADRSVRAWTADHEVAAPGGAQETIASYRLGAEAAGRGWLDYLQGVTWCLARAGYAGPGFDVAITSSLPAGAGLASSAALSVALLRGLRSAYGLPLGGLHDLDDLAIARLAQAVETDFVGAPVGLMDPLAASLATAHEALLIDTRSLQVERLALPLGLSVLVLDSTLRHRHAGGEYGARRRECEAAAKELGVATLRELQPCDAARIARLPPPLDCRVRHVVTENERVLAAAEAWRAGDLRRLGQLLKEGHRSLAVDFAVSLPAIDRLVRLASSDPAVLGARLTGGGFGGAVVALVAGDVEVARAAGTRIATAYEAAGDRPATMLLPPPVAVAGADA